MLPCSPARVIGLIAHENIQHYIGHLLITGDIPEAISAQHKHIIRAVLILSEVIDTDL